MAITQEDKLRYEIEKLELEIKEKRRSFFNQPTFWIPMITVAISLSGNVFQWSNAKNEKTLVEIQIAQAKLDKDRTQIQLDALKQQLQDAQSIYESTNQKIAEAESRLKEATEKLSQFQSPQLKAAAAEAGRVLADARQINQRAMEGLRATESIGSGKDAALAKAKEREGFEKLITGDYDGAAQAFQAADNANHNFNSVSELARLVKSRRADLDDPAKRKEVFRTIVTRYSLGAPADLLNKLEEMSK
jgi:cell division septum initiation protein DivIVA